ncbi:hypothetical protein FRC03_002766 [Tulasnella sp. 419]|nr:hypothetical protein FRC03_002766 [Tulasnella sp. 419]
MLERSFTTGIVRSSLIVILQDSRLALKNAIEAVPSNSSFLRLRTRANAEHRIFDGVFESISNFLVNQGLPVDQFKDNLLQATKRDQAALGLLNAEIHRQENRQMSVVSMGRIAKLKVKLCVESMDNPEEVDLGLFDTSSRLDVVLWKMTQPLASVGASLKDNPNFYARQQKRHQYTKDGVVFQLLTPERGIDSLPLDGGYAVVHLVMSKAPYILATRGHSPRSLGRQLSHGLLVHDFDSFLNVDALRALNPQMVYHITYEIRNISSSLFIGQDKLRSTLWKDLPGSALEYYGSNWLIVLEQKTPDPEPERPDVGERKVKVPRCAELVPVSVPAPVTRSEQRRDDKGKQMFGFRRFFGLR